MLSPFPQFPSNPNDFDDVWAATVRKVDRKYNPLYLDDTDDSYVTDFMDNFG